MNDWEANGREKLFNRRIFLSSPQRSGSDLSVIELLLTAEPGAIFAKRQHAVD